MVCKGCSERKYRTQESDHRWVILTNGSFGACQRIPLRLGLTLQHLLLLCALTPPSTFLGLFRSAYLTV